ncbi:phytanoyl-CoA dioxygenase family protein, partial [Burkholderia cenocepacia]|nr:phytanoyl-CoA dioxygenase family protein [Burkholderia cenocepacia]
MNVWHPMSSPLQSESIRAQVAELRERGFV